MLNTENPIRLVLVALSKIYKVQFLRAIVMQSYPARALDRRLQEDWARDAREGPRVLMSLRVDFRPMG